MSDSDPSLPQAPPGRPSQLTRSAWWATLKRTVKEFDNDGLSDWVAALTYYGVLSVFPGLILLASVLGLLGESVIGSLVDSLAEVAPGPVREILTSSMTNLANSQQTAGSLALVGLAGSLWSASGYVGAFMRASNAIYDVPEGRPIWKTLPIRVAVTVIVGAILTVSAVIVVFTGQLPGRRRARRCHRVVDREMADPDRLISALFASSIGPLPTPSRPAYAGSAPAVSWPCCCGSPRRSGSAFTQPTSAPTTTRTARWVASLSSSSGCGSPTSANAAGQPVHVSAASAAVQCLLSVTGLASSLGYQPATESRGDDTGNA
ncbi:Virulence factor BrkB [Actinoplanes cyaneus]|nr:Virulence factor BrkB [Actinoplanes cyaneus]